MEFVFPEDWPLVLRNFHRALKPSGLFYFTVELANPEDVEAAFEMGQKIGLPVVHGEWAHEGGYHYYPTIAQVKRWLDEAHFHILDEMVGDEYHHFIVRRDRGTV